MRKSFKTAVVGVAVATLTIGVAGTAHADQAAKSKDLVGVGSDTVQFLGNFLADGDTSGDPGYNTNAINRIFSFDATSDASGRTAYTASGGLASPFVVLREGTKPVNRANGSGAGIGALLADSGHVIDFVRSSRLPKSSEYQAVTPVTAATPTGAVSAGDVSLHTYQIAVDGLQMATASTTNAPANLTGQQILDIYKGTTTDWSQIPGSGTSGVIKPYLPPTTSGTYGDFNSTLTAINGGVAFTYGSAVTNAEEHDPTTLTGNPNAIEPFSTGRFNLLESGYLSYYTPGSIKLQGSPVVGTTVTSGATDTFYVARKLYIVVRDADVSLATKFQTGGTQNWVAALFGTSGSWAGKPGNSSLFTAAGVTQSWADLGIVHG